ncbi:ABC transporter substrate-binding protein [Caldanaerobius polysaccharolyticus]|uniref:ABC transporter substrate-binding protein n=1 Tax=Caldanaerobius polysaccharolyticus TaxID=44256 RepID=UPI000478698B|nr:ABC transporter substrate-binding protein [Caldanaerobius polysaccharolyticus]
MKKFKALSVLLVLALLMTFLTAGCKKSEIKSTSTTSKQTSDKSPITFTFFNADGSFSDDFKNPVAKEITKRTGVTLKIDYPVGQTGEQRISLMIASGKYPDLIYAKGDTPKLIEAGALIPLDDLIEKYGPNIKKLYGPYLNRLKYSKDDPHIYTLGAYGVGSAIWQPSPTFYIQLAVLKELGYPKLTTLQDFEDAIKKYKEKHPTIDGQPTIGLSLLADDWRWLISVGNPSGFALGYPDDGQWAVNQQTYEATYKFLLPGMKDYYKWLNHMWAEGLIDRESFTQKYDQYKAKIASGRVLGLADAEWDFGEAETALLRDGKPERTYAPLPIVLNSSIKHPGMRDPGYSGGWGIGITTSCKDPVRAIKFLDWMASDEAQILNNWGIEGVNYKIADGKRVIPEEEWQKRNTDPNYSKKTGVGLYVYPFPQRGDGVKDPTGQYYTVNSEETIIKNYNSAEKEALAAYGVKMWRDLFPPTSDFKVSPYGVAYQIPIPNSSDLTVIQKKADDYCQKAIPQAIMTDPSKFDAAWDKIQKDLKAMGIEKANQEMTKLIKERIELWNSK